MSLLLVAAVLAMRPGTATPARAQPDQGRAAPEFPLTGEPGLSTVPLHLADASVAQLLHSGTRVDIVTAEAGEPTGKVLASMATVLEIRPPPDGGTRFSSAENKGPLVLVSVPTELATQVAALSLRSPVAVTLR